jgi:hypothetical protein
MKNHSDSTNLTQFCKEIATILPEFRHRVLLELLRGSLSGRRFGV